jgi:hypothetical protein
MTWDLDIVHSREPENIAKLLKVLEELVAEYRDPGGRKLKPSEGYLGSKGHQLLRTRLGALYIGAIGPDLGYPDLLPHSTEMTVAEGVSVRVLNLAKLIEIKEYVGGEKDLAVLPVLRRTLECANQLRK